MNTIIFKESFGAFCLKASRLLFEKDTILSIEFIDKNQTHKSGSKTYEVRATGKKNCYVCEDAEVLPSEISSDLVKMRSLFIDLVYGMEEAAAAQQLQEEDDSGDDEN